MTTDTVKPQDSTPHRLLLAAIIIGTVSVAILAGIISYETLTEWARPELGDRAFLFPAIVDTATVLFAMATFYKTMRGYRKLGVRLATHCLAGLSILFNSFSGPAFEYQLLHATAPLVLIISVETVIGIFYKHRQETSPRLDRIRPSRWFLAPVATFLMWRRMSLWEITSAARAREIDRERVHQIIKWQRRGYAWRFKTSRAEWTDLKLRLMEMAAEKQAPVPVKAIVAVPRVPVTVPAAAPKAAKPAAIEVASSVEPREYRTMTPDEKAALDEQILADLFELLNPDLESPYASQAAIATQHGVSTSHVSRVAKQLKVNGSPS